MKVKYDGFDCEVVFNKYYNGNNYIELRDSEDGLPLLVASTNLEAPMDSEMVLIKNYDGNEGLEKALLESGILDKFIAYIPSGFVSIPMYKLSEQALLEIKKNS
ncbi:MAG: hypothetical protein K0R54_1815 [Clostridiaceae bacterium]|jgi:hypothetical protein|nr:hypothetical protein [Clostridiaceae bacterium]